MKAYYSDEMKNTPGAIEAFHQECQRKDKLMALFETLEKANRQSLAGQKPEKAERVIRDVVTVKRICQSHLELRRESGEIIRPLIINNEIAALMRPNDRLSLVAELRAQVWRVKFVAAIGSYMPPYKP